MVEKNPKKKNILEHVNYMKFRLHCPWGRLCWDTQPCLPRFYTVCGFFHALMASRVAAAKATWPAELKMFTVWPLAERLADPGVNLGNHIHILLTSVPILPSFTLPGVTCEETRRGTLGCLTRRRGFVRACAHVRGSSCRTCPSCSLTAAPCGREA